MSSHAHTHAHTHNVVVTIIEFRNLNSHRIAIFRDINVEIRSVDRPFTHTPANAEVEAERMSYFNYITHTLSFL